MTEENPFQPPEYAAPAVPVMPSGPAPVQRTSWFTPMVRIVMAGCVIAAGGLGVLIALWITDFRTTGTPGTGDCLYLTQQGVGQSYHKVSCSNDQAMYKVDDWLTGTSTCGAGDYVRFQVLSSGKNARTLCLALNVKSGDCLRDVDSDAMINKVSCTDPTAQDRVHVIDQADAEDRCEDADQVFSYPGPPGRTVCLLPTGEHI